MEPRNIVGYIPRFHVPSSVLLSRNIVQLYFSVPRNIKKSRKVPYFPVVNPYCYDICYTSCNAMN
jgi:hypothetical protein